MPKFGFTEDQLAIWRDEAFILEGTTDVGIVLVHGWTAMPKQLVDLAKELNEEGYWVSCPKLKGHGTYPEDLEEARHRDWIVDAERAIEDFKDNPHIKYVLAGGVSLGGCIATLASVKHKVDGLLLLGTPAYLKKHLFIVVSAYIGTRMNRYVKKKYPTGVDTDLMQKRSYQYFPLFSAKESLVAIRKFVRALRKIKTPVLIFQINGDYMVGRRSPWMIYKSIKSKYKKIIWLSSEKKSHVPMAGELDDFISITANFIDDIKASEI